MTLSRQARAAFGLTLFVAAVGLTLVANAQPVGVAVKPAGPPGKGKDKNGKDDRDWNEHITLPVEREARNKIEAVNKYLNGKDTISPKLWEDIISVLQGMLADPTDKFVEVSGPDGRASKVSVKLEVNRIIGMFNDDGRQFYQRIVGPEADQKYKLADEDNDMQTMAELSQRYLHTKAGAAATVRVGKWHLDRGRYMQAGLEFKRFQLRNAKDELPAEVLFEAALAFKRQGTEPSFLKDGQRYWALFEKASQKGNVTIGSRTFKFEDLKAEYDKAVVAGPKLFTAEWGLFRGGPSNNEVGKGGTPFLEPRFTYPIMNPPPDLLTAELKPGDKPGDTKKAGFEVIKDRIDKALKLMDSKGFATIPGSFPLASAGKVIFRGYDGVYCIAARDDAGESKPGDTPVKAGEVLWKSDTDFGLHQMTHDMGKRTMFDQIYSHYTATGPHSILIENPLLGTLSHDGTNCYYVDDMAVPPHPSQWMNMNYNGMPISFGTYNDPVYFNKLMAIDLETGKRVWKIGERTPGGPPTAAPGAAPIKETTETLLADCLFLGAPLPIAGKLYVVVEKDGDLRLVCLDPTRLEPSARLVNQRFPSLVWSQVLGQPNGKLPQDALRRFQGIHLAYADGMLICPTNAGAILGIDLFSHSLVWAANYKSNKSLQARPQDMEGGGFRGRPFNGGMPGMTGTYDTSRERWHAGAPIIVGTKVVYTAFDSDSVECVDLHDGRAVWKTPIVRQDADLYVAGVFDEKVLIVGKGYVRFHSLSTGQQLKEAIPTGIPTGVGVATRDAYYLPIKAAKDRSTEPGIVAIDLKSMQVKGTSRSRKKEAAGNLLFYENDVYSLTPTSLSAFPQLDLKIKQTQDRLTKNPNDPIGLLDLALLQLDDGRLSPAIENFRKSLAHQPPEEVRAKAREKLFEAITELVQNDFNVGEALLEEYKTLCVVEIPATATVEQRRLLGEEELRRKSNFFCLVAKGKESQGKLLDAFENYMAFGTLVGNKEMVTVIDEPNTQARPDVWARGRIQNMIRKATPDQRKPLENRVVSEWTKVRDASDVEKLRSFVKVFGGMFEAGTEARIILADRLAAGGNEDDLREAEYMLLGLRDGSDSAAAAKAVESLARLYIRKGLLDDAVGMYAELGRQYATVVVRDGKTGAQFFDDLVTDKRFLPYLEPAAVAWAYPKLKGQETSGGSNARTANWMSIEPEGDLLPFFRRNKLYVDMNGPSGQGWALRLVDRTTGDDRYTSTGFGYLNWHYQLQQMNIPYKFVQIKGHIAVVTAHGQSVNGQPTARVHAFDLADKKKLWEIDLFGSTPNVMNQQQQVNQVNEADGVRLMYPDGWSTKVGQLWVVEAAYTVVLTRDGLVAKDNARGTVLWTKANVSQRTHLVGDGEHVFTFDCASDGAVSPVRCYRAADGVEVPVPDSGNAFTNIKKARFFGRKVLAFDEGDKKAVRLYDMLTGQDVWKRDLGGNGWILRSDDRDFTGFVTAAGEIVVLAAADGREIFRSRLDADKMAKHLDKVADVMLFADGDRFYVMLNRPPDGNANRFGYNPIFSMSIRSAKVNGHMYAFDRKTTKRLWYTEEQLEDQNVILDQFGEVPIILAATHYQKIALNGNSEGMYLRFVALEKTTGKLRFAKAGVTQGQQFYGFVADPKTGVIELLNYNYRFRFAPDDGKTVGKADGPGSGTTLDTRSVQGVGGAIRVIAVPPPLAK